MLFNDSLVAALSATALLIAVRLRQQVVSIRPNHFNLLHVLYQDGDEMWIKRHVKTSQRGQRD